MADADDAAERARVLGESSLVGPFDVGGAGRTATLRDPQGAFFALFEGEVDE